VAQRNVRLRSNCHGGDVGSRGSEGSKRKRSRLGLLGQIETARRISVHYIWPTLRAGGVRHKYLLGTSMARPVLASARRKSRSKPVLTGRSRLHGKGNDQVRFELAYKAIAQA